MRWGVSCSHSRIGWRRCWSADYGIWRSNKPLAYQDEQAIIEFLASQPTPEEVLALHASPALQQRVSELLARSKEGGLSREEEREFDRILVLEHRVRLAKAHAFKHRSLE